MFPREKFILEDDSVSKIKPGAVHESTNIIDQIVEPESDPRPVEK